MAIIEAKSAYQKQRPVKPARAKDKVLKLKLPSTDNLIRVKVNEKPLTYVFVAPGSNIEEVIERWQAVMARNRKIPSIKTYGKISLD
jgi:hypothetical protein